ncbi:MAG TPA: flagellar basal body rod protein FlgB [Rectinemataceae bacterium]|nr:flagellar basal body rod protein FlgB [Rectinemataceae bacterium]
MFEGTSFGKTIDLLQRSMDVATLRRQVISDNIANADVPNFKRSVVDFESSLQRALESEQTKPALQLAVTDPRHISNFQPVDYRTVEPRRVLDYQTTSKNNGNNVDPEEELMASVQNQLMYTLQAQAVNYEFGQVNLVLR